MYKCQICKKQLDDSEAYEYRGAFACEEHHDEVIDRRDRERNQIIKEEDAKTASLQGLDLSDSAIGKANRKLLKRQIEVASKESPRLKKYERGE